MASRPHAFHAVGQILLLSCGVGLVYALQDGFYACALVLALIALWRVVAVAWPTWPRAVPPQGRSLASAAELEQRLLSSLLDQTPAPLLIRRSDGVIRAGNRAARSLFGTDDRLSAPPQALTRAMAAPPADRTTVTLDTQAGPRAYALSITDLGGVGDSDRDGVRLAVLIDIQPELRAVEAAALRDLLQVLGHEIMNALTPVASLAATAIDLLADDTPASTLLARDAVQTLARRAAGLARFVEAYRTLARLPPPDLQPTRLSALVEECAKLFHSRWRARGVWLDVEQPGEEVLVPLDMDLMVHALMNVLSNAAEAALACSARPASVRLAAHVPMEASTEGVRLTVADSGAGVAPDMGDQVFQPFFTTKLDGTGVGLSFARQVALSHGGDLILQPPLHGTGASFIFLIGG
jgi:nitrogen fixation/metabolism regulation signal transduction histidine kinase